MMSRQSWRDWVFFMSEAYVGIKRSALMIVITVATFTVSLVVFGLFLLLSANLNYVTQIFSSKLEIKAYLNPNLTKGEIASFEERILAIPAVESVTFIDKNLAWDQFQNSFKSLELSTMMDSNPLPHSFKIKLEDNNDIAAIADYLKSFENEIEDVSYLGIVAERLNFFAKFAQISGLILVGLLTFATLLIVVNTIRLTVIARQDEILIMKLVGATHQFIRWPFLIEGFFIGISGSIIAALVLRFFYIFASQKVQTSMPYLPLVFDSAALNSIYAIIVLLGTGLGGLGAYISISRSLKSSL